MNEIERVAFEAWVATSPLAGLSDDAHPIPITWDASWQAATAASVKQEPAKGLELAAEFIEKRANDYDADNGRTDPETGTREYPGGGLEYFNGLMELADEVRALAAKENK